MRTTDTEKLENIERLLLKLTTEVHELHQEILFLITTDLANYRGTDWSTGNNHYSGTYNGGPQGTFREQTTPVGSFDVANAFGLYDMHGNVWEWCQDLWHPNYKGAPTDGSAWITGDDTYRVLRGGSWINGPADCRSARRMNSTPETRVKIIMGSASPAGRGISL